MEKDERLETSNTKEPNLKLIVKELEESQSDLSTYVDRGTQARAWWQCTWANQWDDGRKHPAEDGKECFPWNGASDSRLHIISTIVKEHVTLDLVAFWTAKVQAKSIRPFVSGNEVSITNRMLNWRVYTQMKRELLRELPMAYTWKHALGLSFIGIEWEQQREIQYVTVTTDDIQAVAAKLGLNDVTEKLFDPDKAYDDELIAELQQMSQILPKGEARKILDDLRNTDQAAIPIVALRINKPVWTALRAGVDVLIPSETVDLQTARYVARRELVSETELTDRIETDGYNPDFVDEALKHKGKFATWLPSLGANDEVLGSNRSLVEIYHFYCRMLHRGVPCMYRTVFNYHAIQGEKNLHALHRKFEYDHQQYPLIALRRTFDFKPMLTSIGIAEESYTDEIDIKTQQDGINDRTQLIHQPPMIVPTLRAQATKSSYGPRSIMTATRPNEVSFPPLPPMDQTPFLAMQMVEQRLDRRYSIIGGAIDPEIKAVRRQHLANQNLGEIELALEQTLQLMQQFETDEDVQRVAGGKQPWNYSVKDIQGQHEVTATIDMRTIDNDYASMKLDMLAKMMPFKQEGMIFKMAARIIDPDLADAMAEDQISPVAMEKERGDEYNAVAQIMAGIEPTKPIMANPQFRLQVIQQIMQQPQVMQKLSQDEIGQKLLQNRVEFFQNQIQQYQENPQIGRALSTTTFGNNAPVISTAQPAA